MLMGSPRKVVAACLSLVLMVVLIFLQLEALSCVSASSRSLIPTLSNSPEHHHHHHHQVNSPVDSTNADHVGGAQNKDEDEDEEEGDAVFGNDKRKVHTGPNPLHNR